MTGGGGLVRVDPRAASQRGVFARAATWAFVMDSGGQVATLVVSTVLAALLGPEAYGLVAMALVYVMFIQLVQQQGMQAAVIQRSELSDRHKDTAFWLVIGSSVLLTALSVLLAGWWATINRQPDLQPILIALSALLPVRALVVVQEGIVRRAMRFQALALRTIVSVALGGAVGLGGAAVGWGVWALVAQQLSTAVIGLVVLWAASPWRPTWRYSRVAARDLLRFSGGSFLSSIGVFVNNRADALLIGLFFGPVVVGVYRLAARLVEAVLAMAIRPVQSVALPELSRRQNDRVGFDGRLLQLMSLSSWMALPVLGILAGAAETVVALLGPEWSSAVWPLRLLCLVGLVRVVIGLDGPMLQARGLVYLQATASWLAAGVSCSSFLLAAFVLRSASLEMQVAGLAATRVCVYGLMVVLIHLWLLRKASQVRWRTVSSSLAPALLLGLVCALMGIGIDAAATASQWELSARILALAALSLAAGATVLHHNRAEIQGFRKGPPTPAAGTSR